MVQASKGTRRVVARTPSDSLLTEGGLSGGYGCESAASGAGTGVAVGLYKLANAHRGAILLMRNRCGIICKRLMSTETTQGSTARVTAEQEP